MKEQFEPGVYLLRVEVQSDDITHQKAKDELANELADAVMDGMQINGIREPVYGLDDQGNKIIVAYESLAWVPVVAAAAPKASRARRIASNDDDEDFVLTANGDLSLRL